MKRGKVHPKEFSGLGSAPTFHTSHDRDDLFIPCSIYSLMQIEYCRDALSTVRLPWSSCAGHFDPQAVSLRRDELVLMTLERPNLAINHAKKNAAVLECCDCG